MKSPRAHAACEIGRRRLLESLIHPGFYLALATGLAVALAVVAGFVRSVDSSGFDYRLNPAYNVLGGFVAGAFGEAFLANLFLQGPLNVALHLSVIPVLLYLSVTSVYRFGTEKSAGAIELLAYGPADGTAYFLALVIRDAVLMIASLVALCGFLLIASSVENVAVAPAFFGSVVLVFGVFLSLSAYGVLASVLTDSASSALSLYLLGWVVIVGNLIGSYAIVGGYLRSLTAVAAYVVGWLSPLQFWALGLRSQAAGNMVGFLLSGIGQLSLAGVLLVVSHFIQRARGVRA